MAQADAIILSRYDHWKVFGSGTWSTPNPPGLLTQKKVLFGFLYQSAKLLELPFHRLIWCTRYELGEKTKRAHYHWLLGSKDCPVTVTQMFQLNALWDSFPTAGFSRNHIYNPRLNGVEYVTKCLSGLAFRGTEGGDFYESSKFGLDGADVTLSNSFLYLIGGKRIGVDRCAKSGQRDKKPDRVSRQNAGVSDWSRCNRVHPAHVSAMR